MLRLFLTALIALILVLLLATSARQQWTPYQLATDTGSKM